LSVNLGEESRDFLDGEDAYGLHFRADVVTPIRRDTAAK
jgi:hypothetical protein